MSLLNEMELSDSERGGHNAHAPASRAFSVEEDDLECEHPPGTSMAALETKEVFLKNIIIFMGNSRFFSSPR